MASLDEPSTGPGREQENMAGVRLVVLNLPEDEGEGLGFSLTRTLWDPYPWVREVVSGARADLAGLKTGDCLLQADGKDLLGLPVGKVAGLIRGDGAQRGVSLRVWNCGVDPNEDPELLWSCGGGSRGERARRALAGAVAALACSVCAATARRPLSCARDHLYCHACWSRLQRCALCRETLPPKDSPYSRNLVAEQVFEAIATVYEIKDTIKRSKESSSAYTTPDRSPNASPSLYRKGQHQYSLLGKKRVQFNEKFGQNYASDPNIHRSLHTPELRRSPTPSSSNSTNSVQIEAIGNTEKGGNCGCQKDNLQNKNGIPQIQIEDADSKSNLENRENASFCSSLPHKLVARLRQACSLADLQNASQNCPCSLTRSLNNISMGGQCCSTEPGPVLSNSVDNLTSTNCKSSPVFLLTTAPPIYVLSCDHKTVK